MLRLWFKRMLALGQRLQPLQPTMQWESSAAASARKSLEGLCLVTVVRLHNQCLQYQRMLQLLHAILRPPAPRAVAWACDLRNWPMTTGMGRGMVMEMVAGQLALRQHKKLLQAARVAAPSQQLQSMLLASLPDHQLRQAVRQVMPPAAVALLLLRRPLCNPQPHRLVYLCRLHCLQPRLQQWLQRSCARRELSCSRCLRLLRPLSGQH